MDDTKLQHHGVLGMRWGVRKAQKSANIALKRAAGAATESRRKQFHDDYVKKQAIADKKKATYEHLKANQTRGEKVAERVLVGIGAASLVGAASVVAVGSVKVKRMLKY